MKIIYEQNVHLNYSIDLARLYSRPDLFYEFYYWWPFILLELFNVYYFNAANLIKHFNHYANHYVKEND